MTSGGVMPGVLPVYNDIERFFSRGIPESANTGLLHDRYADVWERRNWKPEDTAKAQFLRRIKGHAEGYASHVEPLLDSWHQRRRRLVESLGGITIEMRLTTPLASGTGMGHPLETGFVWLRNLGVPYLPATSLKGSARAWALDPWKQMERESALRIFGDLNDTGVGSVVFHDLYPVKPPALRLDILNPHFGDYYRDPNNLDNPPGDWMSPKPVFFLTVAPGQLFRTAMHLRPGSPPGDLALAEECLLSALENIGVGSKTAIGYGTFARTS